MRNFDPLDAVLGVVLVGLVGFAIWYIASDLGAMDDFKANCREAGGHVYDPEIVLCVSDDGRLVEVYP